MNEEFLHKRVQELEEAQKRLLDTIESFKKQNQELFAHNEKLCLQNLELQKALALLGSQKGIIPPEVEINENGKSFKDKPLTDLNVGTVKTTEKDIP